MLLPRNGVLTVALRNECSLSHYAMSAHCRSALQQMASFAFCRARCAGVVAARWGSVALGGQGGLRWKGWWWCVGLSGGRVQYSSPPCNPGKGTGQPAPWPKGAWGERPHCKSGMTKGACGTEWCARLQV
jgi:hypothetical protein